MRWQPSLSNILAFSLLVSCVAVISCVCTRRCEVHALDGTVLRVTVKDSRGLPIEGVSLKCGWRDARGGFCPRHSRYEQRTEYVSNREGVIVVMLADDVRFYGGTAWTLLWLIPISDAANRNVCRFEREGYTPEELALDDLRNRTALSMPNKGITILDENGERGEEVQMYDVDVVLRSVNGTHGVAHGVNR